MCLCGQLQRCFDYRIRVPYIQKVYVSGNAFIIYICKTHKKSKRLYEERLMNYILINDIGRSSECSDDIDYYFGMPKEPRGVL